LPSFTIKEPNSGVRPRRVRIGPSWRGDDVDDESKPRLPREAEPIFDFALRIAGRIAGRKAIRVQVAAAVSRQDEGADFVAASKARRAKSLPVWMCPSRASRDSRRTFSRTPADSMRI
jgi:hypothetical protein